jgi:hypothetical protein
MRYRYLIPLMIFAVLMTAISSVSCDRLKNIKGSISGTVYMDGRPTSGHILVKDANGTNVKMADTNLNGHYYVKDLSAGDYQLQFLNMFSVTVRIGRPEVVDLQLTMADRLAPGKY